MAITVHITIYACKYMFRWAVYMHECPRCKQIQIPRLDINTPSNAIELDPNTMALYGEGLEDGGEDGDADDFVSDDEESNGWYIPRIAYEHSHIHTYIYNTLCIHSQMHGCRQIYIHIHTCTHQTHIYTHNIYIHIIYNMYYINLLFPIR